jgi:hypothetical protein
VPALTGLRRACEVLAFAVLPLLMLVVVLAGCGQPFDSPAEVISVEPGEVCTARPHDSPEHVRCFDPAEFSIDPPLAVGECVNLRFGGEGLKLLGAERIRCDPEAFGWTTAPAQDGLGDRPTPAPGVGWLEVDDVRTDLAVMGCEIGPIELPSPAHDDLTTMFSLTASSGATGDGEVGLEISRGSGGGAGVTDAFFAWEGERAASVVAWSAVGDADEQTPGVTRRLGLLVFPHPLFEVVGRSVVGEGQAYVEIRGNPTDELVEVAFAATCPEGPGLPPTATESTHTSTTPLSTDPTTADEPAVTSTTAP